MWLPFILVPIIASWCVGVYYLLNCERKWHRNFEALLKVGLILLPIEVFLLSLSTREYAHYYPVILPVVTVLMAFFAHFIARSTTLPASLLSLILLLCVTCYFLPPILIDLPSVVEKYTHKNGVVSGRQLTVARFISDNTSPDHSILVWGTEANVYLLSERDSPTRFFFPAPLTIPDYEVSKALFDEFMSEVRNGEPEFIIDERHRILPPLDTTERVAWKSLVHGKPGLYYSPDYPPDRFQPFLDFVDEEYELMAELDGYAVYRRIR